MADLGAVRAALAVTLARVPGLRVSPGFTSVVNPPCAIVLPGPRAVLRFDSMGGGVSFPLRVQLLVGAADDASSQALMDGYLSSAGPASVSAAVLADPTLGGLVEACDPLTGITYGLMDWAGQTYLGAAIDLNVMTS